MAASTEQKQQTCNKVLPNKKTNQVRVGGVLIGGGAPVVVQSMLNASPNSVSENLEQIKRLENAGCEVVRMAIPGMEFMGTFEEVCAKSPLPVVADVHFSANIAICAAKCGAAKLRINPGNIGGLEKTKGVLEAANGANIPIRIGVNAGSLDKKLAENTNMTLPEKLAASAVEYVQFCEGEGFTNLVVSAKAHDVCATVETYRLLAKEIPYVPLHIGITEAGTTFQGLIKSAAGLGILLESGIGDTLRISLTAPPEEEMQACWALLGALNLRKRIPEIISCPTCGRCKVNLIEIANAVQEKICSLNMPIKVAVMGCTVNGPGEAREADIGIACGSGVGAIFKAGKTIRKVNENEMVNALLEEVRKL